MISKKYKVTLEGATPLLFHQDNLAWDARCTAWVKEPLNKDKGAKGDDRTPAWTWLGYCYHTDLLVLDVDNIMSMLRDAGKKCPMQKGRGSQKAATQSQIIVNEMGWPIETAIGTIPWAEIQKLSDEEDFTVHERVAADLGFSLFTKRAKIGANKHVRVRPRFDTWSASGTVTVVDGAFSLSDLQTLLTIGGRFVGICDWRPGSIASGRFGMFTAIVKEA